MKHQVTMTVIDKKLFPELQERYCADKQAGACPCYNMRGWLERENEMVCCCNDGTRPVIFKLERIDIPEEGE